jgi:hypothetical protein
LCTALARSHSESVGWEVLQSEDIPSLIKSSVACALFLSVQLSFVEMCVNCFRVTALACWFCLHTAPLWIVSALVSLFLHYTRRIALVTLYMMCRMPSCREIKSVTSPRFLMLPQQTLSCTLRHPLASHTSAWRGQFKRTSLGCATQLSQAPLKAPPLHC